MIYIGIDPGLSGAIGVITPDWIDVYDIPTLTIEGKKTRSRTTGKIKIHREYDVNECKKIINQTKVWAKEHNENIEMWLENVHPMPDEGVMGAFSLGKGMMLWECSSRWADISLEKISPVKWKKKMMSGMLKDKDASIVKASQLFPTCTFRGPKGGKLHGRAEALLIAEYGRRESNYELDIKSKKFCEQGKLPF